MASIRRFVSSVNSYTLWAFNTQDVLNPHRRGS